MKIIHYFNNHYFVSTDDERINKIIVNRAEMSSNHETFMGLIDFLFPHNNYVTQVERALITLFVGSDLTARLMRDLVTNITCCRLDYSLIKQDQMIVVKLPNPDAFVQMCYVTFEFVPLAHQNTIIHDNKTNTIYIGVTS